jgi:hypothetical protein
MAVSLKQIGAWGFVVADAVLAASSMNTAAAGDRLYLWAAWKDYAITAALTGGGPGGWTKVTEFADGTVTQGDGTGSMKVACWYRDWQSGDTDPTIDFSSDPSIAGGAWSLWSKGSTETWASPMFVTAAWPSQTSGTVSASSTIDVASGSAVICGIAIADDSATFTRPATAIADSGGSTTWNGNYVESPATHGSTTTGNDMAVDLGYRLVTTGAGRVTLQTTVTALSAAETGAVLWVVQGLAPAKPRSVQKSSAVTRAAYY